MHIVVLHKVLSYSCILNCADSFTCWLHKYSLSSCSNHLCLVVMWRVSILVLPVTSPAQILYVWVQQKILPAFLGLVISCEKAKAITLWDNSRQLLVEEGGRGEGKILYMLVVVKAPFVYSRCLLRRSAVTDLGGCECIFSNFLPSAPSLMVFSFLLTSLLCPLPQRLPNRAHSFCAKATACEHSFVAALQHDVTWIVFSLLLSCSCYIVHKVLLLNCAIMWEPVLTLLDEVPALDQWWERNNIIIPTTKHQLWI